MADYAALPEPHFARMDFMTTESDVSTKLAIIILTPKDINKFEPLNKAVVAMNGDEYSWSYEP